MSHRSVRTGAGVRVRPVYARVLGLRRLNPGALLCFWLFEGMVALSVLLALAELVNWWTVLGLPAWVALMLKLGDVTVGALGRSGEPARPVPAMVVPAMVVPAVGRASVPRRDIPERFAALKFLDATVLPEPAAAFRPLAAQQWIGSADQRARQAAASRY